MFKFLNYFFLCFKIFSIFLQPIGLLYKHTFQKKNYSKLAKMKSIGFCVPDPLKQFFTHKDFQCINSKLMNYPCSINMIVGDICKKDLFCRVKTQNIKFWKFRFNHSGALQLTKKSKCVKTVFPLHKSNVFICAIIAETQKRI